MSGEGFPLPCNGHCGPAANPARVDQLRELVDFLRQMYATGEVNRTVTRNAANELDQLADALEAGGGLALGYAAVPLTDAVLPAPFPPPAGAVA